MGPSNSSTFRFEQAEIDLFAAASWDRNPLHCSAQYAHTTPFGEQVVFGMLGALKCVSQIEPPPGAFASKIDLQFKNPMVLDTAYSVVPGVSSHGAAASIVDGSRTLLSASIEFGGGKPATSYLADCPYHPSLVARVMDPEDLKQAGAVEAPYEPVRFPYQSLMARLGIVRERWGDSLLSFLMLSSYIVGMQIPGERAMFFSCKAELRPPRPIAGPFSYRVELIKFDARMDRVVLDLQMSDGAGLLVRAELQAFLRPCRRTSITPAVLSDHDTHLLDGKLAVVVGASRGLGANLAISLADRGAFVVGTYAKSDEDAKTVEAGAIGLSGTIVMEKSDCSSAVACRAIKDKYLVPRGGLDILVCCACPSLNQLRFEPGAADRILSYMQSGLDLVCKPLCSWLPLLNAHAGTLLYISSSAVEEPPAAWPHYVAMKSAGEGLVRSALAQYTSVSGTIARPSKILTDLINTPLGRFNAEEPGVVSERLISAVLAPHPGRLAYLS